MRAPGPLTSIHTAAPRARAARSDHVRRLRERLGKMHVYWWEPVLPACICVCVCVFGRAGEGLGCLRERGLPAATPRAIG